MTNKVETSYTLNINYTKSKEGKEEEEQERKVARKHTQPEQSFSDPSLLRSPKAKHVTNGA